MRNTTPPPPNKAAPKREESMTLPKTIWGFWFRYGFKFIPLTMLAWAVMLAAYEVANTVMWPLINKWFIAIFENGIPEGMSWTSYALPTIVFLGLLGLSIDLAYLIRYLIQARLWPRAQKHLNEKIYDYLYLQSSQFFHNTLVGKINSQANYISAGMEKVMKGAIVFLMGMIAIGINLTLVISLNWKIAALLLLLFAFHLIWSLWRVGPLSRAWEKSSNQQSLVNGKLTDSLSNFSIVRLFSASRREKRYVSEARQELTRAQIHSNNALNLFWAVPSMLNTASFTILMLLLAAMFFNGTLTLAEAVFTQTVFWLNSEAVDRIVWTLPDFLEARSSAKQAYAELNKPITILDKPGAKILKAKRGKIEIKNVSFKYGRAKAGKRKDVITDFSLTIKPGEKVGIVGRSGAGKTTLVNLILRLYEPTRGKIMIDGQDISFVTQDSLHDAIAFIPQDATMFNRKLCENIGYGKECAMPDEITDAAISASAHKFIMDAPDKFETYVGDRGIKLSGGQRQRIAIARAFLKDAPILVLDEATSALDSETEVAVQKAIAKLSGGRTTIAIAHRLSTLRNMDRIIVMENGRIAEQGPHNKLLKKKDGIYAKLWKMQSGGFIKD
ncbi:MAG: ABC transporter ATP-binding protein/permease [Alphaproteobacteria bacterium]|nr:ABC transporter ATP-binding protein/permease [Alphaproteobacteria bacterium]